MNQSSARKIQKNKLLHRLTTRGWLYDQHGAWPIALLPPLIGSFIGGFHPIHALFFATWIPAFLFFNAGTLWLRSQRRNRYSQAASTWLAVTVLAGIALLVAAPQLLWWGPFYFFLVIIACEESYHRRERSLASRITTIFTAGLACSVAFDLSHETTSPQLWLGFITGHRAPEFFLPYTDPAYYRVWAATALITAYFLTTVPYVRSLIRKRGDRRLITLSISLHTLSLGLAVFFTCNSWASPVAIVAFVLVLIKAIAMPLYQARIGLLHPKSIGLIEMAACVTISLSIITPA